MTDAAEKVQSDVLKELKKNESDEKEEASFQKLKAN